MGSGLFLFELPREHELRVHMNSGRSMNRMRSPGFMFRPEFVRGSMGSGLFPSAVLSKLEPRTKDEHENEDDRAGSWEGGTSKERTRIVAMNLGVRPRPVLRSQRIRLKQWRPQGKRCEL